MIRIAIDARKALDGGIGRHLREIVRRLPARFPEARLVLFVAPGEEARLVAAGLDAPELELVPFAARKYGARELVGFRRLLLDLRAQLFHAPHYVLPFALPCPSVVTVHDVIHLDDRRRPLHLAYARWMLGRAVSHADRVVTVSERSAAQLVRRVAARRDRIVVIPNGVQVPDADARERARRVAAAPPYVLALGSLKPHKNVEGLIRAFARLAPLRPELVLRVHGSWVGEERHRRRLEAIVDGLGLGERVLFLGAVPEEALGEVYAGAACLVAPAHEEGFGLTPLEALAWGVPVVASDAPAHREVLGSAAELVPSSDPRAMAEAILGAVGEGGERRRAAGLERARELSWDRAAEATARVYRELLGTRPGTDRGLLQ